jgi:hypothetical protein
MTTAGDSDGGEHSQQSTKRGSRENDGGSSCDGDSNDSKDNNANAN